MESNISDKELTEFIASQKDTFVQKVKSILVHKSGYRIVTVIAVLITANMPTENVFESDERAEFIYYVATNGVFVPKEMFTLIFNKLKINEPLDGQGKATLGGHAVIGKSSLDGKWYGWSHRACCGFGKGDKIYEEKVSGVDAHTPFTRHGVDDIKTENDGMQAAIAFAKSVS
jgi:hypothetical protein